MDRVVLLTQRSRVRVSGPAGIVGGGSECPALSYPQYHAWGETLEQGTEPPTAPRALQHKWLPTATGVCSRCVCVCSRLTAVCVCTQDGLNAEHKFRVWVTILGHMSHPLLFLSFPFFLIYGGLYNLINLDKNHVPQHYIFIVQGYIILYWINFNFVLSYLQTKLDLRATNWEWRVWILHFKVVSPASGHMIRLHFKL